MGYIPSSRKTMIHEHRTCKLCGGHIKAVGVDFCSDLCRTNYKKLEDIFDMKVDKPIKRRTKVREVEEV